MKNTRTQWFCCQYEPPKKIGEYELKNKLAADHESSFFKMDWHGKFFTCHNKTMVLASYSLRDYCWRGLAEKPKEK